MKIAVSCNGSQIWAHFGHCENFMIYETENGLIKSESSVPNAGHRPGFLPNFLADMGVRIVCAAFFQFVEYAAVYGVAASLDFTQDLYGKREIAAVRLHDVAESNFQGGKKVSGAMFSPYSRMMRT